jgi:hypothetical protein
MADEVDEAVPGSGNIPITLDGKEVELVPSLKACIEISNIAGGLNSAAQRCMALDFQTVCQIIIAGLGLNPVQAKKVGEAVYKAGVIELAQSCIDFINVVSNGGRPLPEPGGEEEADPPLPASP